MKKDTKKILYSEPDDYFPKSVRKAMEKELAKEKKTKTTTKVKRKK